MTRCVTRPLASRGQRQDCQGWVLQLLVPEAPRGHRWDASHIPWLAPHWQSLRQLLTAQPNLAQVFPPAVAASRTAGHKHAVRVPVLLRGGLLGSPRKASLEMQVELAGGRTAA